MVKQIPDNEIYLLFKYIRNNLWRAAKRLSYTEDAWCPNDNNTEPHDEKTMYNTGSTSSVANKVYVKTKITMIHYKYYREFYTQILTPIHCCSICFLGPVPTPPRVVTACCNLK